MPSFLKSLAKRRKKDSAVEILWDVNKAFEQAGRRTITGQSPRASDLQDLVRFCCDTDGIAPWLQNERHVVEKVLAFARKIGDKKVEGILTSALAGVPQPPAVFSISVQGEEPRILNVDARVDDKDWGGTDIALSLATEGLEDALVDELIKAASEIELAPPADEPRKAKAKLSRAPPAAE